MRTQLNALLDHINGHENEPNNAHPASAIPYSAGPNWSDGTPNPSGSAQGQLDNIIANLISTTGQRGAGKITAPATNNWADGTTNPAVRLDQRIDKIVSDLTSMTGESGAGKITAPARSGSPDSLTSGTLAQQLTQILSLLNARGRLNAKQTWTQQQTFQGNSSDSAILISPQTEPSARPNGSIYYDSSNHSIYSICDGDRRIVSKRPGIRSFHLSLPDGQSQWSSSASRPGWDYSGKFWNGRVDSQWLYFGLNSNLICLNHMNLSLWMVSIYVRVKPGVARSGSNRMRVQFCTYAGSTTSDPVVLAEAYDDGTNNWQNIGLSDINWKASTEGNEYFIQVRCGVDGGTHQTDSLCYILVWYNDLENLP
ncbi:MAG: hypothetical protein JXA30_19470 [Deltaproteobacteria bacterium]|nr:hypothetical protein [Deltaproteobacteria bacterium]